MGKAFKFGAFGLFVIALLLSARPAEAKYASFVMDAETGAVLHDINGNTRNYPASLTKMMTLYMVFDAIERGHLDFNDKITISARAARQPSSKLGLRRGETITVRDAILSIVTKSANDVATAIGENLGGTERKFAQKMTSKARRLGMKRTTFRNASGLPHRGQLSTARDMATLAIRLLKDFPQHYHFFSTQKFSRSGLTFRNHNEL
ncbi:MAG: D-alanyl-D-alanine carboxypeptidase, partial [Rhodospirillaceae bacterium]|nr:D-alanyl-D-alanine carboxypeptidase [Rhodospirillaceae bacterium]